MITESSRSAIRHRLHEHFNMGAAMASHWNQNIFDTTTYTKRPAFCADRMMDFMPAIATRPKLSSKILMETRQIDIELMMCISSLTAEQQAWICFFYGDDFSKPSLIKTLQNRLWQSAMIEMNIKTVGRGRVLSHHLVKFAQLFAFAGQCVQSELLSDRATKPALICHLLQIPQNTWKKSFRQRFKVCTDQWRNFDASVIDALDQQIDALERRKKAKK